MSCPGENTLTDYMVGTLVEGRRPAVEAHIATCPTCRLVFDNLDTALGRPRPASPELTPGTKFGRYVVKRQLGAGGMGVVFEGEDLLLGRSVALKLLHGDDGVDHQARLLREAQALARLTHPNVVTVYDVGVEAGRVFLAMEYIDGGTLGEMMQERPRSWDEVLAAYRQAGLGLAAAHDAGIIHRDFKPANALVTADGRICVTDFGLARLADRPDGAPSQASSATDLALTRSGTVLGTPAYMSPEQLLGQSASAQSDVFSFCVALFADLYGMRPFAGTTIEELRRAILAGEIQPRPRYSRVPDWLDRIVVAGLQADAAARPATMRVVVDELARERAAAGIDRAARILAEARTFFRGPNAGLAISRVAMSLLAEVVSAEQGTEPLPIPMPQLDGFADVEIAGDRVEGILANFGPFRLLMSHFVLREMALPTDDEGNIRCEPTRWYRLAPFALAMQRFEQTFGADASYDVGLASSRRLVGAVGPTPTDVPSLLGAIDRAMIDNVRRASGVPVGDAIGHYAMVDGAIASTSPWPCGNDHGLLAGLVEQLDRDLVLEHRDGVCRRKGSRACHYRMRRR